MSQKNNLHSSSSPYLQQHKNNPVFWQQWSKEILNLAKENKKPILLSVGYATCHWCHVMAHESFEDLETSKIMNSNFINIKVDREERPDIDFIFQSSFQLFNQTGGGWPLTMFLDENGVPFSGGTYFPKVPQHGLPSFKEVLKKVSEVYATQREKIIKQDQLVIKNLTLRKSSVVNQDLIPLIDATLTNLDPINGGYLGAPKFPTYNLFDALLYFFNKTKNEKYLKPIEIITQKLCSEGIYDHVEGGIARYTVDDKWLIPHFEKMLYDNVQFVYLISKYLKIKKNNYFEKKMMETITFLNENFLDKGTKLLGSAYDADSEGEEGKYYVFSYDEIKDIKNINDYFDIKPQGNWEGKIILREIKVASDFIKSELKKIRSKKKKPLFDNKIQLDLNCFWISALLSVYSVSKNQKILEKAENYYMNLNKNYSEEKLFHCDKKDVVFLEDYAYYVQMLLDFYDATMNISYKIKADKICNDTTKLFFDEEKKIFQKNLIENNDLFMRPVDIGDNTIPNGNSIMLLNYTRLGKMVDAKKLAESLSGYLNLYKNFMISSIKSLDFFKEVKEGKNCNSEGCSI
tara:strand:- start:9748 stop:11469 length:1722 start_codon:yes stop_codon:yes gene_type:complete